MNKLEIYDIISEIVGKENIRLDELMSKHTTFKVGGAADIFVTPTTIDSIKQVINLCKNENIEYYVCSSPNNSGHTNLLFSNDGSADDTLISEINEFLVKNTK